MEQFLTEYLINSLWQVPLLAAGAWLTVHVARPSPRVQHWVWVGVLPLMVAMPLLTLRTGMGMQPVQVSALTEPAAPASADVLPTTPVEGGTNRLALPDEPPRQLASSLATQQLTNSSARIHWPPIREVRLGPSATRCLVTLYLAVIAFMAFRLYRSWRLARRVVAQAQAVMLNDSASTLLDQCCRQLSVPRPQVLFSPAIDSPMVVGVAQPSLLLPADLAPWLSEPAGQSEHALEAIWLHELAHLRRQDYVANFICRVVALPIAYHPAAFAVQQRIRQTREIVCDAIAANQMESPVRYARCLIGLARNIQSESGMSAQIPAVGMFDGGILEERIMQLIEVKPTVSRMSRAIRLASGTALTLAVMSVPAIFHVTPTMAQPASPMPAAPAISAAPAAPAPQAAQAQAATPAAPAAPATSTDERAVARKKIAEAKVAEEQTQTNNAESRKKMEDARRRLDDAAKAWSDLAAQSAEEKTAENPEFSKRMEDARHQLDEATAAWNEQVAKTIDSRIRVEFNSIEIAKRLAEAQAKFNSPEFKEKMEKLTQQAAEAQARLNSPEFKEQIAKLNSPEFKKQMEQAQAKFNSPEFKEQMEKLNRQMAEARAKFNSPEFKVQIQKLNSPEFRLQIEDARALSETSELQRQMDILNSEIDKQMADVRRQIDSALKGWRTPVQ